MDVFVCWDGDKIGRMVGRAVLDDDVEAVRRIDQSINAGNELWRSFALKHGGSVIEIGGDEGRVQVPASALAEVQGVARQYGTAVGATVSVGVAMKMSEAAKAQLVAKLRGGNQVLIWDPSMQEEIAAATTPKTEGQKISDEYLGKAQAAAPHGAHGGFAGHEQPDGPAHGQKDHDETGVAQDEASAAPAPAEGTHAAADFEDQLHDLAGSQGEQDRQDAQAQSGHLDEVKDGLVRTLTVVRQQMPLIQQLQQTAPEVYASIMALVHGLVDLGREVMGPGRPAEDGGKPPMHKDEMDPELEKGGAGSSGGTEAGRAHLDLPAGSVKDGAIKVKHADGKTGWKQVRAGMIQGQEADAGLLGQNSHPVSSRSPSSK